jgi:hypothetical protein
MLAGQVGGRTVRENEERWKELCTRAAGEQDPEKLRELVHEINGLLSQRQQRIDAGSKTNSEATTKSGEERSRNSA